MAVQLRSILVLFLLLMFGSANKVVEGVEEEEEFEEGLLLRPLPQGKVLGHFHFQSRAPPSLSPSLHHHLFPKSISQLAQKFHVKEMELSFTQGRWNYERWGGFDPISSNNAKPPGVELWAVFDVPEDQVDASWKNLTHTLSGLFCASINFLSSSTMYSAPKWSFWPGSGGSLRYGVLPREAVCTENLTPWLKLLPCRDKAGLSALMDRPAIYRGFYHSQRLHLTTYKNSLESISSGIILEQSLTVVLQPSHQSNILTHSGQMNLQPSWSLSSIFGRKVSGGCVLAKSSRVYVQLETALVAELKKHKNHETDNVASAGFSGEPGFDFSVKPDRVFKKDNHDGHGSSVLYEFSVQKSSVSQPFDLGFTWKIPLMWSCKQAPLHASRFLMGSGNERGAIAILLKSNELFDNSLQTNTVSGVCKLQVDVFQVVPWYIKVYYHTLQLFIDDQPKKFEDIVEKIHVVPSKDKVSPGVMEMVLKLPCGLKSAALTLEFDKGFLHIDEYPPDANQGFDIPSAIVRFPDFHTSPVFPDGDYVDKPPILSKLQEKSPVLSYTEVLLVPLTTPDFSMPYNVITITCTVFALYFGSLLNVLRRRVGEEERFMKSKAAKSSGRLTLLLSKLLAKLRGRPLEPPQSASDSSSFINSKLILKILLVVLFAVAWQYYFG